MAALNFCLPEYAANIFKRKLKNGEIDPEKLVDMTSVERRDFFGKFLGDDLAEAVNASFESKLLLKSQQQGLINWAKKLTGITPEVRRDLLAKVDRMTEVLQPNTADSFLEDLVAQRLGTRVTPAEAAEIARLSSEVKKAKAEMDAGGDRLAYGEARVAFGNYVSDLKNTADKLSIGERFKPENLGANISDLAGSSKSLKASLDNSAIFRQGWKTLFTHPVEWLRNASKTYSDAVQTFGGKNAMDKVQADIQSRPTYDLMRKAKLDTGTTEEQFPTHAISKLPILGRAYKASEAAYTGFVYRMRADVFDKYLDIAKNAGLDITDKKELESIGKLVNSLTGRGHLGPVGEKAASAVNNVFFSPRFFKSNLDFLTAHQAQKGVTPFVRKQAAINLTKAIIGTGTILGIANALKPGSVEFNPQSSDFGKIKIGNTRFDVTGGTGSILVLGARLASGKSKSPTTGKITPLNSGKFGQPTKTDVLVNFAEGKLSPFAGVLRDLLEGQDYDRNKVSLTDVGTYPTIAKNLLAPLPVTNAVDLYKDPKSAGLLLGTLLDAHGIGANTFSAKK